MKLTYVPGAFPEDMSEEEISDFLEEFERQIESGELLENSIEITSEEELEYYLNPNNPWPRKDN